MNRKNLTAAVLAGLAGAAGIAGTAQAVNLNPDGLGQVLIYPYYTSNDDNVTLLSVVNTTDSAKAVKVRFKEGYNSREVLDFNLYMSAYDVWAAAIAEGAHVSGTSGTPTLYIRDTSCTVPYLHEQDANGDGVGEQVFLPFDYTGSNEDGGPTNIARASEGYFEMIEMGTVEQDSDTEEAATHLASTGEPKDCQELVDNWTRSSGGDGGSDQRTTRMMKTMMRIWTSERPAIDIGRSSGGLFGSASIIHVATGTMESYDAKASGLRQGA
jgi:hypothetical protein